MCIRIVFSVEILGLLPGKPIYLLQLYSYQSTCCWVIGFLIDVITSQLRMSVRCIHWCEYCNEQYLKEVGDVYYMCVFYAQMCIVCEYALIICRDIVRAT